MDEKRLGDMLKAMGTTPTERLLPAAESPLDKALRESETDLQKLLRQNEIDSLTIRPMSVDVSAIMGNSIIPHEAVDKAYDEGVAKTAATPQRVLFSYGVFIEKVKEFIAAADALPATDRNTDSLAYQEWRHSALSLISRIQASGYVINCHLKIRPFVDTYGGQSKGAAFKRDMGLTLIELRALVNEHDEFGPPPKKGSALVEAEALSAFPVVKTVEVIKYEWPKKLSVHWLLHEVPPTAYLLLATSFGLGITAGNLDGIKQLIALLLKHFS